MISRYHYIPGIRNGSSAELVGVCGATTQEGSDFAKEQDIPKSYENFDAMLTDDSIDAVILGTPNFLHHGQTLAAAKASKHVLCEKPMALDMGQAQEMVGVCDKAEITLMVAHHLRYKTCSRKTKELLDAGRLGKVSTARIQWSFNLSGLEPDTSWHIRKKLSGGGQIMNVNSHCIDLLCYLFGPAKKVSSFIQKNVYEEIEDVSVVMIEFENGVIATAEGSYTEEKTANNLEIFGSKDSLIISGACSTGNDGCLRILPDEKIEIAEKQLTPYAVEVDHFADAIQGEFEPISSGRETLKAMEIIAAAYLSAESGQHIEL